MEKPSLPACRLVRQKEVSLPPQGVPPSPACPDYFVRVSENNLPRGDRQSSIFSHHSSFCNRVPFGDPHRNCSSGGGVKSPIIQNSPWGLPARILVPHLPWNISFQGSNLRNECRLCSSTSGTYGTSGTSDTSEPSFMSPVVPPRLGNLLSFRHNNPLTMNHFTIPHSSIIILHSSFPPFGGWIAR
jgi:hypothetical protein